MSTLYENLSSLCKSKGITGAKMCNDIGVSKSLMTSLKSGRTSSINAVTAQKIADYFNVPVDFLLDPEGLSFDNIDVDGGPELQVVSRTTRSVDDFIGDASRQKKEPAENDGLPESVRKLIEFAKTVPEDQAEIYLQTMQMLAAQADKMKSIREDER